MKVAHARAWRALQLGTIALASSALVACGAGGDSPNGGIAGTAAVGAAFANANIQLTCKNGSASTTSNSSGAFAASFKFDAPCLLVATGGSKTLHSFAAATGIYNITPLTELLLSYLAGQMGTTLDGLLAGITTNATFQSHLTNSAEITNAQVAVAAIIKDKYGIQLTGNDFLTVAFTPGQPGADADLDKLLAAKAIGDDGQPDPSLKDEAHKKGVDNPLPGIPPNPTGGTGGTTTKAATGT